MIINLFLFNILLEHKYFKKEKIFLEECQNPVFKLYHFYFFLINFEYFENYLFSMFLAKTGRFQWYFDILWFKLYFFLFAIRSNLIIVYFEPWTLKSLSLPPSPAGRAGHSVESHPLLDQGEGDCSISFKVFIVEKSFKTQSFLKLNFKAI